MIDADVKCVYSFAWNGGSDGSRDYITTSCNWAC